MGGKVWLSKANKSQNLVEWCSSPQNTASLFRKLTYVNIQNDIVDTMKQMDPQEVVILSTWSNDVNYCRDVDEPKEISAWVQILVFKALRKVLVCELLFYICKHGYGRVIFNLFMHAVLGEKTPWRSHTFYHRKMKAWWQKLLIDKVSRLITVTHTKFLFWIYAVTHQCRYPHSLLFHGIESRWQPFYGPLYFLTFFPFSPYFPRKVQLL